MTDRAQKMAQARDERPYEILGIHASRQGFVARVRFFLQDRKTFTDEDIPLPVLPVGVPSTAEVYAAVLKPTLDLRRAELLP